MTIKENIEALKRQLKTQDIDYLQNKGYTQAIDDVIDVIQAEFAIINEPKTEGSYLHLENSKWVARQIKKMARYGLFYEEISSPCGMVFIYKIKGGLIEPDGQWISLSAILPTKDVE